MVEMVQKKLEECQLVEQNQDGALANAQEWKYKYEELNDTVHILSSLVLGHCTTRVKQDRHVFAESSRVEMVQKKLEEY